MNFDNHAPAIAILAVYIVAHSVIITALFRARRRLGTFVEKSPGRCWLLATAAPLVGPLVVCFTFPRLARAYQIATACNREFRSDCGFAVGFGYGIISTVAAWSGNAGAGFLALVCLVTYFVQLRNAARVFEDSASTVSV